MRPISATPRTPSPPQTGVPMACRLHPVTSCPSGCYKAPDVDLCLPRPWDATLCFLLPTKLECAQARECEFFSFPDAICRPAGWRPLRQPGRPSHDERQRRGVWNAACQDLCDELTFLRCRDDETPKCGIRHTTVESSSTSTSSSSFPLSTTTTPLVEPEDFFDRFSRVLLPPFKKRTTTECEGEWVRCVEL